MKIFILLVLCSSILYSQAEYVRVENPVYSFLERMEALQLISNYNKFEIPKSRKEIAGHLKQILSKPESMDYTDKLILEDLSIEFELELGLSEGTYDSLINTVSIIGNGSYDMFSEKEKYLFAYSKRGEANIFINLLAEGQLINHKVKETSNTFSPIGIIGGEIRGTFLNNFGFAIRGTNGNIFGDKIAALQRRELKYNYKINERWDETFFDETEGYLTADFEYVKFKFGRDRLNIGYGGIKAFMGNTSPLFDYVSVKLNYSFLNFSFFHGQLLGNEIFQPDSISGGSSYFEEKYLAYHRIGFNISDHFDFGIGEMVVYGGRPVDFSYLNPFAFYKSIEHSNRDRDNAMLFADINNNSIKGLTLYGTLLIDDISFGKIGSGWWGNEIMWNAGFYSSGMYKFIPLDIRFDYLRIEPYTFTHRLSRNNFTNYGYNLSDDIQPNSEVFYGQLIYRFNYRLNASLGFQYVIHGANQVDSEGNVINTGGDLSQGHRLFDSENVSFLDGELEYKRVLTLSLIYEPINQVKFSLFIGHRNESIQKSLQTNMINTFFTLELKL